MTLTLSGPAPKREPPIPRRAPKRRDRRQISPTGLRVAVLASVVALTQRELRAPTLAELAAWLECRPAQKSTLVRTVNQLWQASLLTFWFEPEANLKVTVAGKAWLQRWARAD